MKWIPCILLMVCLVLPGHAWGQHYIGRHKSDVRKMMRENNRELYEDDASRNPVYNMVKYIDNPGNQTLIYFFSDEDTCLYSKWMCDYSMLYKVVSSLNEQYESTAEDSWHYIHEGRKYAITLNAGEWFFTLTTKPEEKEQIKD